MIVAFIFMVALDETVCNTEQLETKMVGCEKHHKTENSQLWMILSQRP